MVFFPYAATKCFKPSYYKTHAETEEQREHYRIIIEVILQCNNNTDDDDGVRVGTLVLCLEWRNGTGEKPAGAQVLERVIYQSAGGSNDDSYSSCAKLYLGKIVNPDLVPSASISV